MTSWNIFRGSDVKERNVANIRKKNGIFVNSVGLVFLSSLEGNSKGTYVLANNLGKSQKKKIMPLLAICSALTPKGPGQLKRDQTFWT